MIDITKRAEEYESTLSVWPDEEYQDSHIIGAYEQGWKDCLEEYGEEIKSISQKLSRQLESAEKWDKVQEVLNGAKLELRYSDGKTIELISEEK